MNLALTALRGRGVGAGDLKPPNPRSRPTTPKPGNTPRDETRPPRSALFLFGGVRAPPDLDDEVGLLERRPSERASRQSDVSIVEEAPRGRRSSGVESESEYWDRAALEPLEALGELYHLDPEVAFRSTSRALLRFSPLVAVMLTCFFTPFLLAKQHASLGRECFQPFYPKVLFKRI